MNVKKVQGKLTNFFKKDIKSKPKNEIIEQFDSPKCIKRKRTSPCKSPQKNIKIETNFENLDNFFDEEFIFDDFKENLNLNKLQRYEVLSSELLNGNIKIQVKSLLDPSNSGTCFIKSPWSEYQVKKGDVVSIKGCFKNEWVVEWDGLFVINSDNLLSTTQIVGSLYCSRKTVLSSIFDEIGEYNSELLVLGCIVHELLQEVLRKKCHTIEDINKICDNLIKDGDFIVKIFMEKMNYDATIDKIKSFIPKICDFVSRYVSYGKQTNLPPIPDNWSGEIETVKDIEENVWSPILGIKGKIDATVLVRVKNKTKIMPLELKTGKVSFSLEHRGQVILYCMLLKELGEFVDSGLLLYLKDEGGIKEIQAGQKEMRDLTLLRNGLSYYLEQIDGINVSNPVPKLPPPINRKSCLNCGHLISCSSALRLDGLENLKDNILINLAPEVTSHLTQSHLDYIFKMIALQSMENNTNKSSISRIWSIPTNKREENGWCISNMEVVSSQFYKNGKFEVIYQKSEPIRDLFTIGQTIIVSQNEKYALTIGFVQLVEKYSIKVLQDKYMKAGTKNIQLDSYESNSILNSTRANFGLLLQNTFIAQSLRESIIDKKIPPFLPKLSSKVKKIGQDIMEPLNKEQCRAVLQALTAERYILIKGMAGTGKTTTIGALIQLLVKMGKRVLITSYTNSAVDNILIKLTGLSILRIGSKIHPSLIEYSEKNIISKLKSPSVEKLEKIYSSFSVVGVTCHGANHPWLQRQEFDYCFVDEATQATQAVVLRPIFLAQKFILIGDPNQLPPLVINEDAKKLGLAESLFKRLDRPAVTTVLKQQYRMNIKINDLANNFVYGGDLKCGNDQIAQSTLQISKLNTNVPDWLKKITSNQIEDSIILLDVHTEVKCTNINHTEAELVKEIILEFKTLGFSGSSIGVISTYKDQVNLLKNIAQNVLNDVEVNTVDQYQGRDKEIIIYSACKNSKYNPQDITSDVHRLTVAITRAKKKLILICDKEFVLKYDNFKKLIQGIDQNNIIKK